jgi:hypothetical protein
MDWCWVGGIALIWVGVAGALWALWLAGQKWRDWDD